MTDPKDQDPDDVGQGVVANAVDSLLSRRAKDKGLVGRLAWTAFLLLAMAFGWALLTALVLSQRHWTAAGLIAVDGGVLVVGSAALMLTWVPG